MWITPPKKGDFKAHRPMYFYALIRTLKALGEPAYVKMTSNAFRSQSALKRIYRCVCQRKVVENFFILYTVHLTYG